MFKPDQWAAHLAIGMNEDMPHRKLNLTTLRSNKRKRQDKKSGRNVDVMPAVMDDVEPEPAADEPATDELAVDDVAAAPAASTSSTVKRSLLLLQKQ